MHQPTVLFAVQSPKARIQAWVLRCLLLLPLTLVAGTGVATASTPGEVPVGAVLRNLPMQGLTGASTLLSEFRGKPLIINVWASWCGPCRDEMASLDRLAKRYGDSKFTVIGVSTDDYPEAAKAFIQRSNTSFRQFIDQKLVLENMLGANHIPLTLLVDAKGQVLLKVYGSKAWDDPQALDLIGKTFRIEM